MFFKLYLSYFFEIKKLLEIGFFEFGAKIGVLFKKI